MEYQTLKGKTILVVHDEAGVPQFMAAALAPSLVKTVASVDEAQTLIVKQSFDLAILDTVGVSGCALLETCHARKLPAALLTPEVVEVRGINQAVKLGAKFFFPREELQQLPERVAEILGRLEKEKTLWAKLFRCVVCFFKHQAWDLTDENDEKTRFPKIYW
jgi:DNA-binding NtrC family response regulator